MHRTERTTDPTAARRLCISVAMLATAATLGPSPQVRPKSHERPTPRELSHEHKGNDI